MKWKKIKYYKPIKDIYIISENGIVKNSITGKELKPYIDEDGYVHITLSTIINGKAKSRHYPVHRLVASTFKNDFDETLTVNHDDDNKLNNHFSNLTMMSNSDNVKLAYITGANKVHTDHLPCTKGINNPRAKINEEIVIKISKLILEGKNMREIYSLLKDEVPSIQTVERIKSKSAWSEISDKYFRIEKIDGKRSVKVIPV